MNLGSVRELKAALSQTVLNNLATTLPTRAGFGVGARALSAVSATPRSLALGVARSGRDFRLAVRVQHRALENSSELELIRRQAKGEVDVRYVGRVVKSAKPWHQRRLRPLRIGGSIGHYQITAGTLGAFVRGRADGALYVLSNNHVLANENRGKLGDAVLQPGTHDGGQNPADAVGKLAKFEKLKKAGANKVDSALASLNADIKTNLNMLKGLGKLAGIGDAFLDEGTRVAKLGRTTGLTRGRVTAFELDNVVVSFDIGSLRFDDQIEIEGAEAGPFSQGGDSGSLIVGEDRRAVALLFAGGDQGGANGQGLTYANAIRTVLDALGVDLAI